MKHALSLGACATALLFSSIASAAHGPYMVMHDDGTLAAQDTDPDAALLEVMHQYEATGLPTPDVLSVWTSFPMGPDTVNTLFEPVGNDVQGIGLQQFYPPNGTLVSSYPPLRGMLLHNDVTQLAARATEQQAPTANFGDYIFLLELSHVWGPAIQIPVTDGGSGDPNELVGFPYHWSYWMDAGGSPAGGNRWTDNGNGTYTVAEQSPTDITYSMLDLYVMGLADASEVPPFGVLENATVTMPPNAIDPLTGQKFSGQSFPWFTAGAFTVSATRRTITMDDVVATNGPRVPARAASPQSFKLGIVLVVAKDATDAEVATAEAAMDAASVRFAPAFARATRNRGTMDVVTQAAPDASDAGTGSDAGSTPVDAGATAPTATAPTTTSTSGCATAPSDAGAWAPFAVAAGIVFAAKKRARRKR